MYSVSTIIRSLSGRVIRPAGVLVILFLSVLTIVSVYTLAEIRHVGEVGFPLDDAWIHMVFSKNLFQGKGFSYNSGVIVSGSTSPLWTLLLGASNFLPGGALIWSKIWGAIFLWLTGYMVYLLAKHFLKDPVLALILGMMTIFTPRLVWASLSGMEVTLYLMLTLLALFLTLRATNPMSFTSYLGTIMFALATLVRPEGIVVFLLVRLLSWIIPALRKKDFHIGSKLFLVELSHFGIFGLILLPNILFNLSIAETPWPNTFPAHAGNQGLIMAIGNLDFAEVLRSITLYPLRTLPSLIIYLGMDSLVLLLWLPFCIFTLIMVWMGKWPRKIFNNNSEGMLIIVVLLIGLPLLRGMIVPSQDINHHYGRYIALVSPLFILISGVGITSVVIRIQDRFKHINLFFTLAITALILIISLSLILFGESLFIKAVRLLYESHPRSIPLGDRLPMVLVLFRTFTLSLIVLSVILGTLTISRKWRYLKKNPEKLVRIWLAGALCLTIVASLLNINIYTGQVKNIQDVQVNMGRWVAATTSPNSLIAVNDIGAIAYFSENEVLDLHGLVSPEMIPFLSKGEKGIMEALVKKRPDFLIIFPNWYPRIADLQPLFEPVYSVTVDPNLINGGRTMIAYRADWTRLPDVMKEIDSWQ